VVLKGNIFVIFKLFFAFYGVLCTFLNFGGVHKLKYRIEVAVGVFDVHVVLVRELDGRLDGEWLS